MPSDSNSAGPSIWTRIEEDISKRPEEAPAFDIWELAEERLNLAKYRPVRIAEAELADVSSEAAGKRYMLRNPNNDKYITLGEQELFLWNLMDGENTLKDLILEYFAKYGTMGQEVLFNLLGLLKGNGFLKEKPAPVMQTLLARLQGRKLLFRLMLAVDFFMHRSFTSKRADEYFDRLYRHVFRPIYTRPALIIILLLLAADLALFTYFFFVKAVSLLPSPSGANISDMITMMLILYGSVFIHENAHGLTVKAFGRKVLRAGLLLYFGSPIWFVDTTDIWMKSRFPRMAVSFGGPCSNALLGGVLFLIALLLPDGITRSILLQGGVLNTFYFFFNLLPVAETDGHYIIQDYLEMPRLRPQSLSFIRRGVWQKLARRERWAKNDFILLVYGLVSVVGTGFMLFMGVQLWVTTGARLVKAILSRPLLVAQILGVLVVIAAITAVVRGGVPWARRAVSVTRVLEARIARR